MSKRKNDGEIDEKSKQQKPNDDADTNEIVVPVGFQDEMQPSAIFKLNAICCDDLFEWLSLRDLHSLGQTCKRMQRLTGVYFQENFTDILNCRDQSIYYYYGNTQLNGFIKFVQKICWSLKNGENRDFQYIGSNCDSLREINFDEIQLTKSKIDFIKGKLEKIEMIDLFLLDFNSINLYEDLLIFCPNLKSLIIECCDTHENEWIYHKYPKLTHLKLSEQILNFGQDIEIFFQQNPQLQSFGCEKHYLLENSKTIVNSMMKLDILKINCWEIINDQLNEIYTLLNKLYENGFYKRLEIICNIRSQRDINLISKLSGLEKLVGRFADNIVFPSTDSLKELYINNFNSEEINLSAMADAFPNLRIVYSGEKEEINRLLPFIRQLPDLKELHLPHFCEDSNGIQIDLSKLHEERKKLSGACKLVIYVPENTYLETKMAPKNLYTNHDLIEIKRASIEHE